MANFTFFFCFLRVPGKPPALVESWFGKAEAEGETLTGHQRWEQRALAIPALPAGMRPAEVFSYSFGLFIFVF